MKYIKLFEQFISEEETPKPSAKDIFIPRRLKERWDDLLIPYLNKGYTKEQILVAKPFNEPIIITKDNIEDFKNIKVIIGGVRIKEITDLRALGIEEVTGYFNCSNNKLTSLEGSPIIVNGDFYCFNNKLTSLEGSPIIVNGDFYCFNNKLTSLEGAPTTVNENFHCSDNMLISLEGAPTTVTGNFHCSDNMLISLEGAPTIVGGNFTITYNSKVFTEKEVRNAVKVKGGVYT